MRKKQTFRNKMSHTGDNGPEPYPELVQDALYNDDYELAEAEQQAFEVILTAARLKKKRMEDTRREFAARGGVMTETPERLTVTLGKESMTVTKGTFAPIFKIGGTTRDRKLLRNMIRATLYADYPDKTITAVQEGKSNLLNIHLMRGLAKVADESIKYSANLDEMARGAMIWSDEDDEDDHE